VFLHEGLGSIAMWRDFPEQAARATQCDAIVYSRYGYGNSDPLGEPRSVRYMHEEAQTALPQLLDLLAIDRPILIGHSDGGSIALIHAGTRARAVRALSRWRPTPRRGFRSRASPPQRPHTDDGPARQARAVSRRRRLGILGLETDLAGAGLRDWNIEECCRGSNVPRWRSGRRR
jgi:pimeloyl-ACP methyl ester carboxylesterase